MKTGCKIIVGAWLYLNIVLAAGAIIESLSRDAGKDACSSSRIRVEQVLPGFRIGCWLGEKQ